MAYAPSTGSGLLAASRLQLLSEFGPVDWQTFASTQQHNSLRVAPTGDCWAIAVALVLQSTAKPE
jgi:hypothetical protein